MGEVLEHVPVIGSAAVIGTEASVLRTIRQPAVQLALWRRPRPSALDWIDHLNWNDIDDIDASISGPDWHLAVSALLCEAGYPEDRVSNALAQELARRATDFADLVQCARLNMRLEVIDTDACRKFHMDYVTARLLMPLHGPGTQWIDATCGSDAPINDLQLGDVAIFKGRLTVETPAILHRSPPVEASGAIRLLFVLNPQPEEAKA